MRLCRVGNIDIRISIYRNTEIQAKSISVLYRNTEIQAKPILPKYRNSIKANFGFSEIGNALRNHFLSAPTHIQILM